MRSRAPARSGCSAFGFHPGDSGGSTDDGGLDLQRSFSAPPFYRLTIEGELGELARAVFEGASARTERGNTVVVVRDQAELLGLMQRVSDLGLTLISASPTDERVPGARTPRSQSPG
jgi:hypothetical protein